MKRTIPAFLALALLGAGCGPAPAPKAAAKAMVEALQPNLEPPRQVVIIPTPEPAPVLRPAAPAAAKEDPNRALAERVKRALEEESRIQAAAIDVTASAGTVTLWGTAASDDERARATRVAARIQGVKWVDNKLAIASGS
jgi:hypothetical protein